MREIFIILDNGLYRIRGIYPRFFLQQTMCILTGALFDGPQGFGQTLAELRG